MNNHNVISAFSEDQVERLTGITKRQLRYWDQTGFFEPSLADENRRRAQSRIYSFRDVLCLQVLNELRNESRVSLPHLREVKEKLGHLGEDMWASTTLYVLNRRVIFDHPQADRKEEVVSGQGVLQIPLEVVRANMQSRVQSLFKRDKSTVGKIQKKRGTAHNRPVVAGTRVSVRSIRAFADAGYSIEAIRKEYPHLTEEDIQAALKHSEAA